jgi:hypothetical protein
VGFHVRCAARFHVLRVNYSTSRSPFFLLSVKVPVMTIWPGVGPPFPSVEQFPGIGFPLKFRVALVMPPPEQPVMLAEPETADDRVVWLMTGVNLACPLTLLQLVDVVTSGGWGRHSEAAPNDQRAGEGSSR